ncbi:kinesin KIF12 [Brachionus plicatilis]|uniref:Kinesin-like protein n=1 Tax=Brachionus plicatilis TaxID=10195 RepID=A0A3M7RXB2_BRAPC|nr:kinesin KIF12 [Brachionus plicatilis]
MSVKTLQEVHSPRVFMIPDQKFKSQASSLNESPIKRKSIEFEPSKATNSRRVSKDAVSNKSLDNGFVKKNLTNRGVQTDYLEIVKSGKSESIVALSGSQISSFATSTSRVSSSIVTGSKPDVGSIKSTKNKKKKNYQDSNNQFGEKDKVRVVVRIRPTSDQEQANGDQEIVSCDRASLIVEGKTQSRKFFFDSVFDPNSNQDEVFNYSGIKRLIDMAIDGFVCTCFAYGQTGSGKTYTMVGPAGAYEMNTQDRYLHFGLIPRSINYLFNQLRQRTSDSQSVFYIRVSYYEIYNEQIRDLINPNSGRKLEIRGSQEEGFFVDNLFATYIETMDEILTILREGEYNRSTASHLLNEHSSRSHAVLTIQVENELQNSDDPREQMTKLGKLIFVDLAGSEKVKVTMSKGKQLTETNNINKSLLVLGTCISALSDQNKRDGHIPYRDSKLTKLLSESLGGSGITLMIACISPAMTCENESLNTLRYANRAQNIENVPLAKSDSRENIVLKLKRELRKLKEENHVLKQQLGVPNANNVSTASSSSGSRFPKIRNGSSHSSASTESELYGRLREYMKENKSLKNENSQLERFREKVRKEHEVLTRENEKLARKLDQVLRTQGVATEYLTDSNYVAVDSNGAAPRNVAKSTSVRALPKLDKNSNYTFQQHYL